MKQIKRHIHWTSITRIPPKQQEDKPVSQKKQDTNVPVVKNNKKKKEESMNNDKLELIEGIVSEMPNDAVKVIKQDRGLIERTESSKIILTEDNRQVLVD